MRRNRQVCSWLAVVVVQAVVSLPAVSAADDIITFPIRTEALENGLTIVSVSFDSPGTVACAAVVRAGTRDETSPPLLGLAHILQHLITGDADRTPRALEEAIATTGLRAFTADDWTFYGTTIPASALGPALAAGAERFGSLAFDDARLQRESALLAGRRCSGPRTPERLVDETLRATAYTTHPYHRLAPGTYTADPKRISWNASEARAAFERWYSPGNCAIVVVGDVTHEQVVALVRKAYGNGKMKTVAETPVAPEPVQRSRRQVSLTWPGPTSPLLTLAYPIPSANRFERDGAALRVMADLVFGPTSPLYKALVLDERVVNRLEARADWSRDAGLFTIRARLATPSELADIRWRIETALAQAASEPVSYARLAAVKDHARYRFAGALDSAGAVARAVAWSIAATGRPDAWNSAFAAERSVTVQDVQRVAGHYFAPTSQTVVTLVPESASR